MSTVEIRPSPEDYNNKVSRSIYRSLAQAELPVSEAVSKMIVYCSPDTLLHEAALIMSRSGCSSILVREGKKYIGIWTEYDALKIDFANRNVYEMPIRDVMSSPVMTISNTLTMREVAVQMRLNKVRHFLVLDENKEPYAIVTQTDIVLTPVVEHYLKLQKVSSVLYHSPVMVDEDMLLSEASSRMRRVKADAIIVVMEKVYGIITERDLTRFISEQVSDVAVGKLATIPLQTASDDTNLYKARQILEQKKIRHLGITNKRGKLLGIIGFADILSSMEFVYIQELSKIVQERNKALDYAEQQIQLFERVIETTNDGVCFVDPDGFIIAINPSFTQVTGFTHDDIINTKITQLGANESPLGIQRNAIRTIFREGSWQGEVVFRVKGGKDLPARLMVNEVNDKFGQRIYYIVMISDLTHLKEREEQVRVLSLYNPLTNLPNREFFEKKLQSLIEKSQKKSSSFTVMLIDLNRFRRIVEMIGKAASNHLLKIISGRLHDSLREDDILGHTGPDEFVLILDGTGDADIIQHLAERVINSVEKPIHYNEEPLIITARVGIAIFPQDGQTAQDLIGNVYTAATKVKHSANNMYQFYSQHMNVELQKHVKLENDLRRALNEKQFVFYYQPIVDARTRKVIAFEALMRWKKDGKVVSPDRFLAIAEEIGLIKDIGLSALGTLGEDYQKLKKAKKEIPRISLNVSVRQFQDDEYMKRMMRMVDQFQIDPKNIVIELTESIFLDMAADNIQKLSELRQYGFQVVLDDFGTGYSSLSYLRNLPADYVKLDKSFILEMEKSPESIAFVEAIIRLSHTVNLPVVAEGVESALVADILQNAGCDMLQGYHFCKPAPLDELLDSI